MTGHYGKSAKQAKGSAKKESGALAESFSKKVTVSGDASKAVVTKFPLRPQRTGPAPGQVVRLQTNFLLMSIITKKPIYRYGVDVNFCTTDEDGKKPKEGKIRNDTRRRVVKIAIEMWVAQNKPKDYNMAPKFHNFVFDLNASTVYTLFNMMPSGSGKIQSLNITVPLEVHKAGKLIQEETEFIVQIHPGNLVDIKDLFDNCLNGKQFDIIKHNEAIRFFNVLAHSQIYSLQTHVITKHSVFPFDKRNQFPVGGRPNEPGPTGVFYNRGYSISTRPTITGVALNVSNTGRAFYDPLLITDFLKIKLNVRDLSKPLTEATITVLKKEFVTKQIEAIHLNYGTKQKPSYGKYRVSGITSKSCSEERFTLLDTVSKTQKETTIVEYYKTKHGYVLKYPNLPCIQSNDRKFPLEVCKLFERQGVNRRTTPQETADIIKKASVKPEEHFKMIENSVSEIKKHSQAMIDFGVDFNANFIEVDGRELMPCTLLAGRNRQVQPRDGSYQLGRVEFYKPARINKWGIAFFGDENMRRHREFTNCFQADRFAMLFNTEAKAKGIVIANPPQEKDYVNISGDVKSAKRNMKNKFEFWNESKLEHVFIIIPDQEDWKYAHIQYLEITCGKKRVQGENFTRTSCIKFGNYINKIFDRNGPMFLNNLLLKYNTKMGGINVIISPDNPSCKKFLQPGYIFIACDVCHPAPGDKLMQSVAGVVGMWNISSPSLSFSTQMRVQLKKKPDGSSTIEDIQAVDSMIEDILKQYYFKNNKNLPTQVVILRDGVSEGQYGIVQDQELRRIHAMLSSVYNRFKLKVPQVTCLVVQKRNNVRFKRIQPVKKRDGSDDFNVQPGTVVDSVIVHPTDHEFYCAPHKAIQGTSRVARYYVIHDEIKFSQDEIQAMVNALSYMSPRCTKSISIPGLVSLADRAAERGKHLVISWNDDNTGKMSDNDRITKLNQFLTDFKDTNYKNTMFYI